MMIKKEVKKLIKEWEACGIQEDDTLMVHSSLSRILKERHLTPEDVLESFLLCIGKKGTLMLPLFNFGFCHGEPFDIRYTPSKMGILTETGRKYPGAVRTGHPMYSFAIIGYLAESLKGLENFSGTEISSPFGELMKMQDSKIASIDLIENQTLTLYHHVEDMEKVKYRFHKEFRGLYTDWNGKTTTKSFSLFVRNLEMCVKTNVFRMGEYFWSNGFYKGNRQYVNNGLRIILASDVYREVSKIIRDGKALGMLYERG